MHKSSPFKSTKSFWCKIKSSQLKNSAILVGTILIASLSAVAQVPGDYDLDGKADLAVATVDKTAKTTTMVARSSSTSGSLTYSFAAAAESVVTGRWYSDHKTYPGIVYVKGTGLPLEWAIKNPQGTENTFSFGLIGDTIPNVAYDLDGDGITDPVVARNGFPGHFEGFKLWYSALSGSGGAIVETVFGLATDKVYVGQDVNGQGRLYALRGDFTWYGRTFGGTDVTSVQWGLTGDTAIPPQVIAGQVAHVVVRSYPTGQVAFIRYENLVTQAIFLGSPGATAVLGNFFGLGNDFAMINQSAGTASVRLPDGTFMSVSLGTTANAVVAPIGQFIHDSEKSNSSGVCANTVSISDLPGILYKPINEHGGRGPTMIFQAGHRRTGKNKLVIRDANCNVIASLGLASAQGPYGERFYSRSGGSGQSHTQLHALALQSAGSTNILIEGKGDLWIKIEDPENRQGRL